MKNKIVCLVDYKGNFGSKWMDSPYRSGMDKNLVKKLFIMFGYDVEFKKFFEIDQNASDIEDNIYLYTSSEDIGYYYKSFIEDIILAIQEKGGHVIPEYKFLRANNNKVFMEALRKNLNLAGGKKLQSYYFGTLEEFLETPCKIDYPIVFKLAEGSMGFNVELAKSESELISTIKKYCRTFNLKKDIRDFGRAIKRKGYLRESLYRRKFILQSFIPNLKNDWKVYVFFDKYYVFYRPIHKQRVFKASGGGYDNYFYGKDAKATQSLFNFAETVFDNLNVPHASLDIGFDGENFYLFEFQCVYFGNAGVIYSDEYFLKDDNNWVTHKNDKEPEKVYVESIVKYIEHKRK